MYGANNGLITSPLFSVFVYETVRSEFSSDVVSSDSFKFLTDLISNTTEAISNANNATAEANAAAEEARNSGNAAVEKANEAIATANVANEIARGYLYTIQTTVDGKLRLLDADMNIITTIDTFCGDDDTLHRYVDGMLSVIGIKERNKDNTYRVWVGTHEEYTALPEIDSSTFYWVTDDNSYEEFVATVNALIDDHNTLKSGLETGDFKVKKAETADTLLFEGHQFGRRLLWSGSQVFVTGQGNWYKIPFEPSKAKFLIFEFELQQSANGSAWRFRSTPVSVLFSSSLCTVYFPFPNYNETTIMGIQLRDGDGTNNNVMFILDYVDRVVWNNMKLVAIYEEF